MRNIIISSLKESIRTKVYYVALIFAGFLLFFSMLVGGLGGGEKARILTDFGLATIELIATFITIFIGVSLLFDEISSQSIYIFISKPITRTQYLLGRYFGLVLSVFFIIIISVLIHLCLMLYRGFPIPRSYILVIFSIFLKVIMIASIAFFFSMLSTSKVSGFIMCFLFWVLGHFSKELIFLAKKAEEILPKILVYISYHILPNFYILNWKEIIEKEIPKIPLSIIYAFLYSTVAISLSLVLFNRKEL